MICEHPFIREGARKLPTYFWTDDAYHVRVDLPGVSQETVRVWAENRRVYFEGEDAKSDEEFDKESPRKFEGNIPLLEKLEYKFDEMKYVVKDGVLKVRVPIKIN